ncbi:MAG: hypothetical protein GYB65_22530 [Chloroflexi bacterium]|nr:hypothetical protein [Chloroflexota bacterium]
MVNISVQQAARIETKARDLWNRAIRRGRVKQWWAKLTGNSRELLSLMDITHEFDVVSFERIERKPVRLANIRGTAGRLEAFDIDFYPLAPRLRDRWKSIAKGMLRDISRLPPIELIQVGDDYYVVDGHHRVSVARALKYISIDADVITWEVTERKV